MWDANVTNPITYVTQISYLLFLKMLEEMDAEQKDTGNENYQSLFGTFSVGKGEVDYEALRWSRLTSDPDNERMLRVLRDNLPLFAQHPKLSPGARAIFQGASVVIPTGAALRQAVDIITPIRFLSYDADVKGDLFEHLVNDLGSQKKAAQFRTPRHLVRVITEMVDPKIGQTVCDSACGSGGFLIAAYEHILRSNTSPEFIHESTSPEGLTVRRGIGDKLTRAQWDFLQKACLHGFEGDQDILRMTCMNAVLHQFDASPLIHRDSICGGEDNWDDIQFDCILENPPFSGSRGDAKRSLRIEKGDKYVLFLAAAMRSLRAGGTAGIVFPSGLLGGSTASHIVVKERLLKEFDLQAVVVLPNGMFEPYTPNPTCFVIFRNSGIPTENVWFFKVDGDGSSLKKARKFGAQFRDDLPDLLQMWPDRRVSAGRAWLVPAEKIVKNNYVMTLSELGLIESEAIAHGQPENILASVIDRQNYVLEMLDEMRDQLETETVHE